MCRILQVLKLAMVALHTWTGNRAFMAAPLLLRTGSYSIRAGVADEHRTEDGASSRCQAAAIASISISQAESQIPA